MEREKYGYKRTECDCEECVNRCKTKPGMLLYDDLVRIYAKYLRDMKRNEIPKLLFPQEEQFDNLMEFMHDHFVASLETEVVQNGEKKTLPLIVPRRRFNMECVFLEEDRCLIHEYSPFGCAYFDHENHRQDLLVQGLGELIEWSDKTQAYYAIWKELVPAIPSVTAMKILSAREWIYKTMEENINGKD